MTFRLVGGIWIVRSTESSLGNEIECGVRKSVDQQCTFQSILGPHNLKGRGPFLIYNVGHVVNVDGIDDLAVRSIVNYGVEVTSIPVVFKDRAV